MGSSGSLNKELRRGDRKMTLTIVGFVVGYLVYLGYGELKAIKAREDAIDAIKAAKIDTETLNLKTELKEINETNKETERNLNAD